MEAERFRREPSSYADALEVGDWLLNAIRNAEQITGLPPPPAVLILRGLMFGMLMELGRDAEAFAYHGADHGEVSLRAFFPGKEWDGGALPDGTLLVFGESSSNVGWEVLTFGHLRGVEARRILWCTADAKRCRPIFERSDERVQVIAVPTPGDALPSFDRFVTSSYLRRLTLSGGKLLRPARYITPSAERRAELERALPDRPRVGLCWRSGGASGVSRTPPLELFSHLAALRANFVSLQYGATEAEIAALRAYGLGIALPQGPDPLDSLEEAFARTDACDTVISILQTGGHIAGALGKPTFILSPCVHSTDWTATADRSVFYPSMRIIFQRQGGEWAPVFDGVVTHPELLAALPRSLPAVGGEPVGAIRPAVLSAPAVVDA